jgi:membrane-associated phospholipid phosphatase
VKRAVPSLFCGALAALATMPSSAAESLTLGDLWTDTKLYFTSPLRWDADDWLFFGGAVGAVAAAHQFDGRMRRHFAGPNPTLDGKDKNSTRDALPAAAAVAGTWLFAQLEGSQDGRVEAYTMLEAGTFSVITATGLKYAAGRARPNETWRVDDWRTGGSSFPSLHSSAAFAVGTVLAESGGDDLRWLRRIVGYGLGGATAYLRLKDNSHWFSDVVAGAAIGVSTGVFTVNRRIAHRRRDLNVSVAPAEGGGVSLRLSYTLQ